MPKILDMTTPQECSRLHRSPPLFSKSYWSNPDEREMEKEERETERDVILGIDRRLDEMDRSYAENIPLMGWDVRHPNTVPLSKFRSRSRSRSCAMSSHVGSRSDFARIDASYNRDEEDKIKIKKAFLEHSSTNRARDYLQPDYLLGTSNLMDRSGPFDGPPLFQINEERLPPPNQGSWRPQLDISNNRLQIQREMEKERERLLYHGKRQSFNLYNRESDHKEEILRREYFKALSYMEMDRFGRESLAF